MSCINRLFFAIFETVGHMNFCNSIVNNFSIVVIVLLVVDRSEKIKKKKEKGRREEVFRFLKYSENSRDIAQ